MTTVRNPLQTKPAKHTDKFKFDMCLHIFEITFLPEGLDMGQLVSTSRCPARQ